MLNVSMLIHVTNYHIGFAYSMLSLVYNYLLF